MKSILSKPVLALLFISSLFFVTTNSSRGNSSDFQGEAYYISKSTLDLGRWGARMSEAQKKQMADRLRNRLEKSYVLTFTKEASFFKEQDKLDAISGATDSWGKNFAAGDQYKNVADNSQIQTQEFYGKKFLVKDKLLNVKWNMGTDTKTIGNYTCFKATAKVPTNDLTWYDFSWGKLRNIESDSTEIKYTNVEAWYTPQIPVSHGPSEYWGLPGLILEVSAANTTMLCTKIVLNPEEQTEIKIPNKGKEITKEAYQSTIIEKMKEFRNNRMGRRRG